MIVVKDAGHGATSHGPDGTEIFVPTPASRVVERVGAGDAFAAGYLAALLEDRDATEGLRRGHLMAVATLGAREDVPTAVDRVELRRLFPPDV